MNKTHNTNIGGAVFHVEEDAYEALTAYLASVEAHFRSHPDAKDIVADIEGRIAEQLAQSTGAQRIVTRDAVARVIEAMGTVDQFGDAGDAGDVATATSAEAAATGNIPPGASGAPIPPSPIASAGIARPRLFRDRDDQVVAGVASGIAAYFDISPAWIRVLFLASLFLGGTGFLVYIVMWICVPAAKTVTDKLRMRGTPVTLETIDRTSRGEALLPGTRTTSRGARFLLRAVIFVVMLVPITLLGLILIGTTCAGFSAWSDTKLWDHGWSKTVIINGDTVVKVRHGTPSDTSGGN